MTCLEKYLQDHPNRSVDFVIYKHCPNGDGHIDIDDPEYCDGGTTESNCTRCWSRQIPDTEPEPTMNLDPKSTEAVNHPKHYGREGAMECIDEMVLVFGVEATMNFCLLNAWKYRYRAGAKGGDEDLRKSDWYLAKYAELKGGD